MPTVRKRGDLQWQAIVKRQGIGFASKTFTTKKDAEAFKRNAENDFYNKVVRPTETMTVAELMDEWDKSLGKRLMMNDLATNTVNGYRVNIQHIKRGIATSD